MSKTRKMFCLLLALLFTMSILLTACGEKKVGENTAKTTTEEKTVEATKEEPKKLEPVDLVYYIVGSEQKDLQAMNDEMNKLLKEKINAAVKINLLDWGAYDQKMNVSIAAGEPFDLCFTAPGFNDYYSNIAKGAFIPLDELMDKYAPKTKAGVPAKIWNAAKVKGKIYGIINYQIMATAYGFAIQRELADKYKFDYKTVSKLEDLDPYLAAVKKGEIGKIPLQYTNTNDPFTSSLPMYNLDAIGDAKSPGVVYFNDSNLKVVNQYDTPEFKNLIKTMRKWYLAGFLKKDASTTKDVTADTKAAKYATLFPAFLWGDTTEKDNFDDGNVSSTGVRHYNKKLTNTIIGTSRAIATMTAISKTSKNPERAMMFIELLNSDVQVFNTISWGIEGKHYKKVDGKKKDGTPFNIELIKDSGYNPQTSWEFGNNANLLLSELDAPTADWVKANETADVAPTLGFTFDSEPVKSEIAQSTSVVSEYLAGLTSGSVDIDKYQPQFIEKLNKAGAEKIIAEKQKQIDEWKATR